MIRQATLATLAVSVIAAGGVAQATSPSHKPTPPTTLQATQKTKTAVIFQWKAPKASKSQPRTGFKVYDNGTYLGHTAGSSFKLSDAKWKGVHSLSVLAYGKYGSSAEVRMAFKRASVGTTCMGGKDGSSACISI